jgi:hypothetical protein
MEGGGLVSDRRRALTVATPERCRSADPNLRYLLCDPQGNAKVATVADVHLSNNFGFTLLPSE